MGDYWVSRHRSYRIPTYQFLGRSVERLTINVLMFVANAHATNIALSRDG